jgi:[ribosomal protein S18]-alanine N-acetyltransferase
MSDDFRIVAAGREHLPDIVALERVAFPSPWRRQFFESELEAEHRFLRVAISGAGDLVGYVFAMIMYDEMHINKIAVTDDSRRRGFATRLMDVCVEHARERGITTISLEVRISNEPAQAFYRKLHFEPLYVRKNYYPDGEAAVVMIADINAVPARTGSAQ